MNLKIRELAEHDPEIISYAFKDQGWDKPITQFERYISEQNNGERTTLIAEVDGVFADYGNAQVLYVKRGYVPDGKGIHDGQQYIKYGDSVVINDDIVLYLIKTLD